MSELDGGSDLSELSDAESNEVSLTPGVASTPRTTPTPGKNGRPIKDSPHSPSPISFNEGKASKKREGSKNSDKASKGREGSNGNTGSKGKGKQGKGGSKGNKYDDSDDEASSMSTKEVLGKDEPPTQDVTPKVIEAGSSVVKKPVKKPSMKGWAYVTEPVSPPKEDTIVEGRRARKPTAQFVQPPKPPKPDRKASSSELPPSEQSRQTESPLTTAADVEAKGSKPRIKINISVNSKKKPEKVVEKTQLAEQKDEGREDTSASLSSVSPVDDDEDEGVQPISKKRKRSKEEGRSKAHRMLGEDDDDQDDDDFDDSEERYRKSKTKGRKSELKSSKTKSKKRREEGRAGKAKRRDDTFAADDGSDDYHDGKMSEDDVMSEDDDDEAPSVRPTKAAVPIKDNRETLSSMPRLKRKSEALQGDGAKAAPRHSTGSMPKTVAGIINAFQKPALSAQNTPAKPPPVKTAIRKVPSMNLFENLMGFGSTSKDSTPGRSPAVRPRPSGGAPQGTSPMVRPPGSVRKEDEAPASGTATPTRVPSSLSKPSSTPSNGATDKRGANGEHVTAAEMAIRRKQELQANANPTGLFDLLEGAEIMMRFEAETRALLPTDAVIARYKLYKASHTEGLSKLVDRIKETNLGELQAQTSYQTGEAAT